MDAEQKNWAEQAVTEGEGSAAYDVARKVLAAAAMALDDKLPPETAAGEADGAVFGQSQAYRAGAGEISAEDAADAVADRKASWFVSVATPWVMKQIETGCEVAGAWLGGQLGNPALGAEMGRVVGHFAGKLLKPVIEKGLGFIEMAARKAWGWMKEKTAGFFARAGEALFSR